MSEKITIRKAKKSEINLIAKFLKENWSKNHIFINCPDLLFWQHKDVDSFDELTFLIGGHVKNKSKMNIFGVLGFIPINRFDKISNYLSIALAIWKVKDDLKVPGLGIQLLKELSRLYKPDLIFANGISEMVKPIYNALGYNVGEMQQAALFLTDDKKLSTCAINIPSEARKTCQKNSKINIVQIRDKFELSRSLRKKIDVLNKKNLLSKSSEFIHNRYLKHPWYKYTLYLVYEDKFPKCLLVTRKVISPIGNVLRIIDIFGDHKILEKCCSALRKISYNENCDYVDIVYFGIDKKVLKSGGFVFFKENDLVLPNYFSPFVRKNITLSYAYKNFGSSSEKMIFFRGDTDQDRPNTINEIL